MTQVTTISEKICSGKCKRSKPLAEFSKDKNKKDGHSARCKSCSNDYAVDYRTKPHVVEREKVRRRLRTKEANGDFYIPLTFEELKKQESLLSADVSPKRRYTSGNKGRLAARAHSLKTKYGMSIDEFHAMYKRQRRKCAICRSKFTGYDSIHVDHCHVTNTVRGLLCPSCNKALGLFHDNVDSLRRAVRYLLRAKLIALRQRQNLENFGTVGGLVHSRRPRDQAT